MSDKDMLRNWNGKLFELKEGGLDCDGIHHIPAAALFAIRTDPSGQTAIFKTKSAHWSNVWQNVALKVNWTGQLAALADLVDNREPTKYNHFVSMNPVMIHRDNDGSGAAGHKVFIVPVSDDVDSGNWKIALQLFPWTGHDYHDGTQIKHLGVVHGDEP